MKIATIGEALIDFTSEEPLAFRGFVGGCHLNVAVAAARLGVDAGFVGQLSSDFFGDAIRAHMRANGVGDSYTLTSDAPTTLAFVQERAGDAHFQFFGERAADRRYDPQPRPSFPTDLAFLMFGSISLLHEPARTAILDIVDRHRARVATVLDPNVRPKIEPDPARYREHVESWIPLAGIVKASEQDLTWLYPDARIADVVGRWLGAGVVAAIVTRGSHGSELHRTGHRSLTIRPPEVDVVDTVGAGDTFTGALMAALVEHGVRGPARQGVAELDDTTWRAVLERAAAAAALNCTRPGADPPRREELERFLVRASG